MDELKLTLSTKIMKNMVTKLLTKVISKKLGCKIDIQLNELQINMVDGKVHVHANMDAEMNKDDLVNIIANVGED